MRTVSYKCGNFVTTSYEEMLAFKENNPGCEFETILTPILDHSGHERYLHNKAYLEAKANA